MLVRRLVGPVTVVALPGCLVHLVFDLLAAVGLGSPFGCWGSSGAFLVLIREPLSRRP
jgi:hypothetical protein